MTDRELLELAAKAAGIQPPDSYTSNGGWIFNAPRTPNWNPLTDDGDALRLAVKLGIDFYEGDDDGRAAYAGYYDPSGNTRPQRFAVERHNAHANPYAATRRAIVRAAAEIGRQMP